MRSQVKSRLVPRPWKHRTPITRTTKVVNSKYTTAVIGGNSTGPVHGWEAITPKRTSKPDFLLAAQQAEDDAWENYIFTVDAVEQSQKWDYEAVEDAWDLYEDAKRKAKIAYEAWCEGLDAMPIPF